jgi:hypothetical protein
MNDVAIFARLQELQTYRGMEHRCQPRFSRKIIAPNRVDEMHPRDLHKVFNVVLGWRSSHGEFPQHPIELIEQDFHSVPIAGLGSDDQFALHFRGESFLAFHGSGLLAPHNIDAVVAY